MRRSKLCGMLLSLFVAFCLWLFVVTNISQGDEITFYNIPVVMEGESVLNERNLMVTNKSTETVSVRLSGTRSDLNKVNSGNILVKVDLSKISEPGRQELSYSPSFPGDVPSDAFVVENKNPGYVYVEVDYRRKKEIPIRVRYTGTRSEGYIYDTENAMLDNGMVTIIGPAAVADQIACAVIEVDLTNRVESVSESFRYTLCNEAGEPVDAQQISTNVEEVRLDLQIQQIKTINLTADIVYGGGASEDNTTVKIEPESIRVSGGEALLNELGDSFSVGVINLAELDKNTNELKFTIALPEGITNQTGVAEAAVTVKFSGLKTKEFVIDDFESVNVPAGLKTEIINANLAVKVRGPVEQIDALTEEDIRAVVDFSAAEVGSATYRVNLTFGEGFSGVGQLKTVSVSATVQEAGD